MSLASESAPAATMQLDYLHYRPALDPGSELAPTAAVVGRVTAGARLTLCGYATLRADGESIVVGANGFFAERATVHIADSVYGTAIGNDVTVGRFALVHGCTVGDGVVVGDGAAVTDGASVGAGALIAAGSLVPPRKQLAGGWLHAGSPAVPVRPLAEGELAAAAAAIRVGTDHAIARLRDLPPLDMAPFLTADRRSTAPHASVRPDPRFPRAYVAPTALVSGDVTLADDAGIYFACAIIAGDGRIVIGPRTNIQDNSLLVTDRVRGEIVLGTAVTIGHNVRMGAAVVEDDALIGMASQLGDGVVVERGGCVAARAWVEPGTVVKAGWIWAGRPACAFRELKDAERELFANGCDVYVRYGRAYLGAPGV